MNKLKLRDLFFGNIDAKNELLTSSEEEIERFLYSFCLPPTIIIDDLLSEKKYFITGMKGIGKTALLRYVEIIKKREKGMETAFILFKSEVDGSNRKALLKFTEESVVSDFEFPDDIEFSYITAWKWFIYRLIIESAEFSANKTFEINKDWKRFSECIKAPLSINEKSGFKSIIPRLNKGKVKISSSPGVELDFDWEDRDKGLVDFTSLMDQADNLFKKLATADGKLTIFFDELELNTSDDQKRKKDIRLIRDLIIAIEQLNSYCFATGCGVRILAAIRTEVITSIEFAGKEVNKIISDFGIPIIWHRGGVTLLDHPLLEIVVRRLLYSEKSHNMGLDESQKEVWKRYFPNILSGKNSENYILNMTWLRPRDIVRILNIAREGNPNSNNFNDNVIAISRKEYSQQSWIELTEELSIRYSKPEIEGIKYALSGFVRYFNLSNFVAQLKERVQLYPAVEVLTKSHSPKQLLIDLYDVGIIGNVDKSYTGGKVKLKQRYCFKGDSFPILDTGFVVHNALCPFFGIK